MSGDWKERSIIPGLRCSGFCSKCRFCTWRNSTQCLCTFCIPFIGKNMCDLISLLRNSSTRPLRSFLSVVFRYGNRRQGKTNYHTPKMAFVWIFLICYQFSEVPKMICSFQVCLGFHMGNVLCCGSSWFWASWKLPATYILGQDWVPHPLARETRLCWPSSLCSCLYLFTSHIFEAAEMNCSAGWVSGLALPLRYEQGGKKDSVSFK